MSKIQICNSRHLGHDDSYSIFIGSNVLFRDFNTKQTICFFYIFEILFCSNVNIYKLIVFKLGIFVTCYLSVIKYLVKNIRIYIQTSKIDI